MAIRFSGCSTRSCQVLAGLEPLQFGVLGAHPHREHLVDPAMVGLPAGAHRGSPNSASLITASSAWGRS